MKKDHLETNKFQGLRYYAISSSQEIIAVKSSPEAAYTEAISKGEHTPIIFGSNTIIKNKIMKIKKEISVDLTPEEVKEAIKEYLKVQNIFIDAVYFEIGIEYNDPGDPGTHVLKNASCKGTIEP